MSALAKILKDDKYDVIGSDIDTFLYTQKTLISNKIKILSLSSKEYLKSDLVIIGHSFMDDYLIKELYNKNIPYFEYHKFLDFYINKNKLICICGSHGKTTLTSLFSKAFSDSSYLIGDGTGHKEIEESFFFLESCEYKDHFLTYHPKFEIISNIDYDHVDYFHHESDYIKSFKLFSNKVEMGLINYEDKKKINNPLFFTYGLDEKSDFYLKNYKCDQNGISGDLYFQTTYLISFSFLNLFGKNLLKDIIAVLAFAYLKHLDLNLVIKNINNYEMAKRRFNIYKKNNQILIDDFAHHPTQIIANYETVKSFEKDATIIAVFRPDRITRFKYFLNDYKKALSYYDKVFVLPFINGKNSEEIKKIETEKIKFIIDPYQVLKYINNKENNIVVCMSSKSLDIIEEIIKSHLLIY